MRLVGGHEFFRERIATVDLWISMLSAFSMQIWKRTRCSSAIGIDLGTANTIVVAPGTGIVFDQPSICCFQGYDAVPQFISAGDAANSYVGKLSKPLKIVRPLKNGVLSDMPAARELLHFAGREVSAGRSLRRTQPHVGLPLDSSQSERRALRSAALDAGFGEPIFVPEPLLAALGAGLRTSDARGRMLVDCGAGVTEAVVISLGGICVSRSARGGGNALDQALIDHINFHHRFQIGFPTAELLKLQLSGALANAGSQWIEVRGLDTTNGLPRTLSLPVKRLAPVWTRHIDEIVQLVRDVLGKTSPELSQDILEDGITLTGGGALSGLLATRITEETGVRAAAAQNSRHCVAFGLQRLLEERMREVPGGSASPSDTKRRVN